VPTCFLIQESVYETFVEPFAQMAAAVKVAMVWPAARDGALLANRRRLDAIDVVLSLT